MLRLRAGTRVFRRVYEFTRGLRQFSGTPGIVEISLSELERHGGRLGPRNLQKALESLHRDGIVMLKDVVNHDHLDVLNKRMVEDAYYLRDRSDSPFNYNRGNIQQDPPPEPDLMFKDIFLNDFAIHISSAYLGGRPKWTFNSGNTALLGAESQPVHTDADIAQPPIPFAVVINTSLVSMSPANGSTEIWLGTHTMANLDAQDGLHGDWASGRIKPQLLEERRGTNPPIQPNVPKGAILVRDLRLWHCGKPNRTEVPRVMLAQIHFAPWYQNPMRLKFPKGMENVFTRPDIEVPVDYQDQYIAYLDRPFGNMYDFGQTDN